MPAERLHEAINLLQSEIQELRVLRQERDRLCVNRSGASQYEGYCQESSASGPEDREVDKCQRLHALTSQLIWRKTDMRREAPDALGASYLGLLARLLADGNI